MTANDSFPPPPGRAEPPKGGTLEVIYPNQAQFNRIGMGANACRHQSRAWDEGAKALCEPSLLWGGGEKLALLPALPDSLWLSDVREAFGYGGLEVFCDYKALSSRCEGVRPRILGWGATPDAYRLAGELSGRGGAAFDWCGAESFHEAICLESKAGFRIATEGAGIKMPEGYVMPGYREAALGLTHFRGRGGGVLKAAHGVAGLSVALFGEEEMRDAEAVARRMETRAAFDPFWEAGPVILEERVGGGKTPRAFTADWFMPDGGEAVFAGAGAMRIAAGTRYAGLVAGAGALDDALEGQIIRFGRAIAGIMRRRGVTGWFNCDFVLGEDGLLATEANVRRSCPTHGFEAASFLFGERWARSRALLLNERVTFRGGRPTYQRVREGFAAFNREEAQRGVWAFPTSSSISLSLNPPRLSFLLTAPEATWLGREERKLLARVGSSTGLGLSTPPMPEGF